MCPHRDLLAAQLDSHTDDRSRVGDQLERPGLGHRDHPAVEQTLEQARDQGGAGDHDLPAPVVDVGVEPGPGLGVETDVAPVGGERRDLLRPLANAGHLVGHRAQRSAADGLAARQLRLVIHVARGDFESCVTVGLDEVDHRLPGAHERAHQFLVHRAERLRPKVGHRVLDGQVDVGRAMVRRGPDDAAGDRGGAADRRRLLVDRDRGAVDCGGQCRRQPGRTGAEHDDVDFLVPRPWIRVCHGRLLHQCTCRTMTFTVCI